VVKIQWSGVGDVGKRRSGKARDPIVYVVDDDDSIRRAIGRLLQAAGYATALFASAREFLDYERPRCPACLILDIWLPGMGGLELQSRLAEAGERLPVVMITGHGDEVVRALALAGGARAVLDKPFGEEQLLEEIRLALGQESA
jgi:FixJ family two-component response regulator